MNSLLKTIKRIVSDLRSLQHIESYVIAFLAIVFAVMSLIGDQIPDEAKLSVLLAGVGVLVFNLTVPKSDVINIENNLTDRTNRPSLESRLQDSEKVWVYGISASNLLASDNASVLWRHILSQPNKEFLVIIQNPNADCGLKIAEKQTTGAIAMEAGDTKAKILRSIEMLQHIENGNPSANFEYRFLDYSPGFSMLLIDPHKASGLIDVEFQGFRHKTRDERMLLRLKNHDSARWYKYWGDQYQSMWSASRTLSEISDGEPEGEYAD